MTALAIGDVVKVGVFGDVVYVVRCPAARRGWWYVWNKLPQLAVPVTRIVKSGELRLIRKRPTYAPGEKVSYQGREARILEDLGDSVEISSGLSKVEISKADLVVEYLNKTQKENDYARY